MPRPVNGCKPGKPRANEAAFALRYEGSEAGSNDSRVAKEPEVPIVIMPALTVKKLKHQAPQDAIDEFWAKFDSKTPGRASTILPKNQYAKKASEKEPKGEVESENAVKSYEEASKDCKEKVEKIVKECKRINQKYRDQHFDIEFDLKWGINNCMTSLKDTSVDIESEFDPGSVKRVPDIFDNPQFFSDGVSASDIRQGRDGDCWILAALCTLGNKEGLIEKLCVARDEQIGVYGFVFHRDGEWISEIVDDKLYLIKPDYDESWSERILIDEHSREDPQEEYRKLYQSNSSALYFAQCADQNETWLPLLQKAYAKAHGDYASIEGGWTGEGLEDLTGGVTTELFTNDILDKEYFWKEELMKVNEDFLFGCGSGMFVGRGYRRGIWEGHAYSIMKCVEIDGKRFCLVRNPWGKGEWNGPWSDGSKEWTPEWMQKLDHRFGDDGQFWMTYQDLLKTFDAFDRTRLFTDEWKVTQKWTSLTVPWAIEYNDTKFSFELEKKTSVVIVLSQLDARYFCGLQGQYKFAFTFRVHQAGEEDYIVRSQTNYCYQRSATTELELEAGEYHVLVKVEAERNSKAAQVEDVLRNNVKDRRDKVLRIGFAYDLAHAKGRIFPTDEEKEAKKKTEKAEKDKTIKKMREKLTEEKKKRVHNENREKRRQQSAAAKRKLKEKAKAEKKAEKKAEHKKAKEAAAAGKQKATEPEKTEEKPPRPEEASEQTKTSDKVEPSTKEDPVSAPSEEEEKPVESKDVVSGETKSAGAADPTASETKSTQDSKPDEPADESDVSDIESEAESIKSDISSISTIAAEDAVEEEKLATQASIPLTLPASEEDEDEFQKDAWNAVAIVGLRIYAKDCGVTVKVVRPRDWEDGEGKLDVDDSARDATKGVDGGKEDEDAKKEPVVKEGESKQDGNEGSGVMV